MIDTERREAARQFINRWRGKGKEDEDGRSYWIELLSNIFGVENVTERIDFEKKVVVDGHTKRIDVYIPETKVIIEQKSLNVPLDKKVRNSGEVDLTAFEQADRYNSKLIFDERARWIVTCNFAEIWIYDMNERQPKPSKIMLEELQTKYSLLDFLIKKEVQKISHEMEVSIKAGEIVGLIYNAFLEQYKIPKVKKNETEVEKEKREHKLKSLNVAGWYFKASKFMANSLIKTAFVSTNSITQGEQVSAVWQPMYKFFNIHIDFAYRTFRWDSEANLKAHVHCVIIGFSCALNSSAKVLYTSDSRQLTDNINPYLLAGPTVFINRQSRPISDVPPIHRGSQPTDNGNFILTNEEKDELLQKEPQAAPFIRPYMMGKDFIVRHPRYCIWLVGANPTILKKCPQILQRVQKVRDFRLNSKKAATRIKANTPMLFDEIHDSSTDYVAIPKVSSERRRYIPMDYVSSDVISGDKLFMMPNASLYHFGVLNSNVHMAWMRAVGGRLKSDYSYSNTIVYNNFPWPTSTDQQKEKIEQTARKILDARELYPDSSLADLYDPLTMPPELLKAHTENNKVVMAAYGFTTKMSEEDCVAELMKLYQKLIKAEKRR